MASEPTGVDCGNRIHQVCSVAALAIQWLLAPALALFGLFYGLDWVATVPPTVKLAAERFGPEKAGLVFSWVFAGHQLGAASSGFSAGASRTRFESYVPPVFVTGALCVLAALLILTVERPATFKARLQAA